MLKPSFSKCLLVAACAISFFSGASQAQSVLRDNDLIALCGDSITEQKQYSVFIENYLTLCQPTPVKVMQFGWSGEASNGFLNRMESDVLRYKPTLATTCYGMNDGRYRAIDDATRTQYRENTTNIVEKFQKAGARVIVGSPGAVDTVTFNRDKPHMAPMYNNTLSVFRDEAQAVADKTGQGFADVHQAMLQVMTAAKEKLGPDYPVAGGDGVHPGPNGQLVMAYAFLKAMKLDGNIGTINIDLVANTAVATEGHQVVTTESGKTTIESTRFPFCFVGDAAATSSTISILPFLPFNQELNRLTLRASGPAERYKVTWGSESRTYTADELKAGVNLAADFLKNPFLEHFDSVDKAVRAKQGFETKAFKGISRGLAESRQELKNDVAIDAIFAAIQRRHDELTADIAAAVKPVRHTITIEPEQ
ncbi:MAG TPA: SGNH/GDSL hydrolase family protein [Tepidisphaeraceae bacterium]